MNITRKIVLTPATDIRTEKIDWLYDCWIPKSSVVLLAGREGIGKSTIAVSFVADVTTGRVCEPMNVGYVVTEDSRSLTVVPRLRAAGADLSRVSFIDATQTETLHDGSEYTTETVLDLPGDFPILEQAIKENNIGMVILDAAKSVMSSKLDGNSDTSIRQFLEPMSRIAQNNNVVFIGLAHFGKKETADTGKLILGSSAWSQVARSVISVAEDKDNGTVRVWNSKANLAPRIRSVDARIVSEDVKVDDGSIALVGRVEWLGEVEEDGSSLLEASTDPLDDYSDIERVLLEILQDEPLTANKVFAQMSQAGYSKDQAKRAKKKLGIRSMKVGMDGWVWALPSAKEESGATPSRVEALPSAKIAPFEVTGGKKTAPFNQEKVEGSEGSKGAREGKGRSLHDRYEAICAAVQDLGPDARVARIMRQIKLATGHAEDVPELLDEMVSAQLLALDGSTYRKAA